jgi:hypothetical protein
VSCNLVERWTFEKVDQEYKDVLKQSIHSHNSSYIYSTCVALPLSVACMYFTYYQLFLVPCGFKVLFCRLKLHFT